jgi:hypothetical protein
MVFSSVLGVGALGLEGGSGPALIFRPCEGLPERLPGVQGVIRGDSFSLIRRKIS